ncbi:MAG TPA: amidohydrolase family protein, partial [Candidatus Limnocylindrales bacterium]
PADLVLHPGRISTVDAARTTAAAVAVRAGRIVAVGSDVEVRPRIGPRTRVIDLRGRTVTPGFGDAHVHPVSAGLSRMRCDLVGVHGVEGYLNVIAGYAASHPDEPWIRGDGWSMADFPGGAPHRRDLDRILPDRPVFLESADGHTVWVNGRALDMAGLTADNPDPDDGRIERDADGQPTGVLQEGAVSLIERLLPSTAPEDLVAALRLAQAELHAFGVTHWQDAIVTPDEEEVAYTTLAGRGELTARVVGSLWWDREGDAGQIDDLIDRRERTGSERYRPTSVKLMQDGILENGTGAVLEPYLDRDGRPTTNRGLSMIDPDALGGHVARLDALGFQAHVHAIGERAVREALDAVETARRANGPSDTRPHIAHIQVIHPDDIGRFASLGVTANAQALWATHHPQMDDLTIPFLGGERAAWQYPFGSLLAAGAPFAMGSDWAVSSPDPLLAIETAVTRVDVEARGEHPPFLPHERIDLIDALAGYTAGSARVNHLELVLGSIEVGKTADLVVLDRDLFDRTAGAIGEARVVATFIDGRAVHEAPELEV